MWFSEEGKTWLGSARLGPATGLVLLVTLEASRDERSPQFGSVSEVEWRVERTRRAFRGIT